MRLEQKNPQKFPIKSSNRFLIVLPVSKTGEKPQQKDERTDTQTNR